MIYSATAAVHAIVLFALSSIIFPGEYVLGDIYNSVLVEGNASFGDTPESIASQWNYSQWYASERNNSLYYMDTDSLWLPVFPRVWDNDSAPVLAIVGTAFLMVLSIRYDQTPSRNQTLKLYYSCGVGFYSLAQSLLLLMRPPLPATVRAQFRSCVSVLRSMIRFHSPAVAQMILMHVSMLWIRTIGTELCGQHSKIPLVGILMLACTRASQFRGH